MRTVQEVFRTLNGIEEKTNWRGVRVLDLENYPKGSTRLWEVMIRDVMELDEVVRVDDPDDWSGARRLLVKRVEGGEWRYGFLVIGWGSCSGCDAMLDCSTWEELEELKEKVSGEIRWFDDYQSAEDYIVNHDWRGQWYGYNTKANQQFIDRVKAVI